MPFSATIYRVFIASPSDVATERRIVEEVIHSFNSLHSEAMKAILLPVRWEVDATPDFGARPQALINHQLVERSDILVAMFWTRLGTPTGSALSGAVEEIELARQLNKPCLLYFSSMPVVPGNLDISEFDRVNQWRKSIGDTTLYRQYADHSGFRSALADDIVRTMRRLSGEDRGDVGARGGGGPLRDEAKHQARNRLIDEITTVQTLWNSEKASGPRQLRDGQVLLVELESVCRAAMSEYSDDIEKTRSLANVITGCRKAQDWRLFLDGGQSFAAFWNFGDSLIREGLASILGDNHE